MCYNTRVKEKTIKKKVYDLMKKEGYVGWSPAKVKFQETDIFGIFDGVFLKLDDIRWIQWTTVANMKAREKKILAFLKKHEAYIACEVWGVRPDGTFKIIHI